MAQQSVSDVWRKGEAKPRNVQVRVSWPDDDKWKEDPLSKVFEAEWTEQGVLPEVWQSLGSYSTKSEAQKAIDTFVGSTVTWPKA